MGKNSTKRDSARELMEDKLRPAQNNSRRESFTVTNIYRDLLMNMSMNRFRWHNLPSSVDERFLEYTLIRSGKAVFYFDKQYSRYLCLRAASAGVVNMYDNPTSFTVNGNSMVNKTIPANECVPIWNNYMRRGDMGIIREWADKLAQIDRTIDINVLSQRTPFLITANNNERLTLTNLFRQVEMGAPVIFGADNLSMESLADKLSLLDLRTDKDLVLNTQIAKNRIWQEALTLLGITNVNTDKKERLVADEANGADGQVLAMRAIAMNARRQACDLINSKYGLDVSVEWNLDDSMTKGTSVNLTDDEREL